MELKLEDFERRIGKSRHIEVKVNCETCGNKFWAKWSRVKIGMGKFCSRRCYQVKNAERGKETWGKEVPNFLWDKARGAWIAYWLDETGKRKTTTKAKWLWERHNGRVPKNYVVTYIDNNPANCELENLKVISRSESNSIHLRGHIVSDETKRKISEAHSGKVLSEAHKLKIGETTKRMWIEGVFDAPEIREAYRQQGLSTKGSKRTEEQRKKMSESRKGQNVSQMFTEEAIEKRRKGLLGRSQSVESNLKRSIALKGRKFTRQHLERLSEAGKNRDDLKGKNSRWWRGGVSDKPYPQEFSRYLKRKIRKRDKYTCQACGQNVYGSRLGHVHHIDGNKQNCSEDNLMLLCATCHNAVHGRNNVTSEAIEILKLYLE